MTSLTSTFDRKWKSLVNPSNLLVTSAESNSSGTIGYNKQTNYNDNDRNQSTRSPEVYRDPSLHKSLIDKSNLVRTKTVSVIYLFIFFYFLLVISSVASLGVN